MTTSRAWVVVETSEHVAHRSLFVGAFATLESARNWIDRIGGSTDEDGQGDQYSVIEQVLA